MTLLILGIVSIAAVLLLAGTIADSMSDKTYKKLAKFMGVEK